MKVPGQRYEARAKVVAGAERARLWDSVKRVQPRFAAYEGKAGEREIPIVALEPSS